MEYAIGYVAIIFVLQAIAAVRTPREDTQTVFVATVFWPAIILLVAGSMFLDYIGWRFDTMRGSKMFGYRTATNPVARGWAVTVFGIEFQLYTLKD